MINLTRKTGAGSLAHEWGHALDHLLHSHYGIEKPIRTVMGSDGDGNAQSLLSTQILHAEHNPSIHSKLPPKVKSAYENVLNKMLYTPLSAPDPQEIKSVSSQINELEKARRKLSTSARKARLSKDSLFAGRDEGSYIDEYNSLVKDENKLRKRRDFLRRIADPDKEIWGVELSDKSYQSALQRAKEKRENAPSRYKEDSDAVGSKGYWGSVHEMFARAFESYIEDELGNNSQKNTYLVDGTQTVQKTGKASWLTPTGEDAQIYPQGAERQRINQAMKQLVSVLREEGVLSKSLTYLDQPRFTFSGAVDALLKGLDR